MLNGTYADKTFESYFRNNQSHTELETAFIVEEVYHLIRYWRLFSEIHAKFNFNKSDEEYALYHISCILRDNSFSDSKVLKYLEGEKVHQIYKSFREYRAINQSIPNWLDDVGFNELGDRWGDILDSLNQKSRQIIRVNTLKGCRQKLQQTLLTKNIETQFHKAAPDALILNQKSNVFKLPEFKLGLFEMQDISSQFVGHFADPQPGMRVIDACAGNGGKTLHLASLMRNKGRIIALDIFSGKLDTLRCRAARAGISIIETRVINSTKVIKRLHGTADIVLLDVPCSGLGVLKRNPEIKWRLQLSDLENLRKTQEDILNRYSLMVKPGGKLIYSTCSILPSENSLQIENFLTKHSEIFDLEKEKIISPEEGFDGFYMVSLKRKL